MSSTPWMVVCDQKDYIGLNKLHDTFIESGCDKDSTVRHHVLCASEADGGNTAIHYAALSDFSEALKILTMVLSVQDKCSVFDSTLKLLGKGNDHGDTPIMMLCVKDFSNTLDTWILFAIQTGLEQGLSWDQVHTQLTPMLQLQNSIEDTALSLAYGHGNNKVLDLLLKDRISTIQEISSIMSSQSNSSGLPQPMGETFLLHASHQDIQRCQRVLQKVEVFIQTLQTTDPTDKVITMIQEGLKRKDNIRRSLVILQVSCARLVQKTMTELLTMEEDSTEKKKDTNRRKSIKHSTKHDRKQPEKNDDDKITCIAVTSDRIEKPKFTTLMDGTIVSSSNGLLGFDDNCQIQSFDETWIHSTPTSKSTEDLLKDRCIDGMKTDDDISIDATLKSLCLESSMLLLTAHGMALQLSPSQLDAVELLLKNQLDAVRQAKDIQTRLLSDA